MRAVLHVRIDEELFARTLAGDPLLLARTGARPTAARAALARQILLLDAERRAEGLSPVDYLVARTELTNRLGTGVGVLLEALTP